MMKCQDIQGLVFFKEKNEKVYFTGCLSGAAGEESAGSSSVDNL